MEKKRRIQDIVVKKNDVNKTPKEADFKPPLIKPIKDISNDSTLKTQIISDKKINTSKIELKDRIDRADRPSKSDFKKNKPVTASVKKIETESYTPKKRSASNLDLDRLNQKHGRHSDHNYSVWGIAFIAIFTLFFVMAGRSVKTEIQIWPRVVNVPSSIELEAVLEPIKDQLGFDQVVLPVQIEKDKSSVPTRQAQDVASGVVVIYNEFSQNSQRLIEETRFETADGKIYKIAKGEQVVIPGYKLTADGEKLAGTAEIKLYAENSGEEYNKGYADLKIVGFKGSPKFDKFYARTKEGFTGGKNGLVPDLDSIENVADWQLSLKEQLIEKALSQINSRIPEGFYIPPGFILFNTEPTFEIKDDKLVVSAELIGIILSQKDLTQSMANILLDIQAEYGEPTILNLSDLHYELLSSNLNQGKIRLKIEGNTKFSFNFMTQEMSQALVGQSKENGQFILEKNPGIAEFKIKNRPFWVKNISDNEESIKYQIKSAN